MGLSSASYRVVSLQRKMGLSLISEAEEREQPPITAAEGEGGEGKTTMAEFHRGEGGFSSWPALLKLLEKTAKGYPCDFRPSGSAGEDVSPSSA